MSNDTFYGSIEELILDLEDALTDRGISASFNQEDGVLGLIDQILEIGPIFNGVNVDTHITCTTSNDDINFGGSITFTGHVNASYNDFNGYLKNARICFYNDNVLVGSCFTDSNGDYSYIWTPIIGGRYHLDVVFEGTNAYKESSISLDTILVRDTSPKTIFLESDYENVNQGDTIGLSAIITDYIDDPVSNVTVSFYDGDTLLGVGTTNNDGVAVYNYIPSVEKTYHFKVVYSNVESNIVNVGVYDTSPVSISLTSNLISINYGEGVSLVATTIDQYDNPSEQYVLSFYEDNTLLGTSTTNKNGIATYNHTPSNTGNKTYTVKYNNVTSNNQGVVVNKLTPTLTITSTENEITDGNEITVSGYLTYNNNGITNQEIELYNGNTLIDTLTTDNNGYYTKTLQLIKGTYTYKAVYTGTNIYNNTQTGNINVIVKYNPTLTLTSNTNIAPQNTDITVSGYLKYNDTGISGITITILDGSISKGTVTTDNNGYYSKTITLNDESGTHTIYATTTTDNDYISVTEDISIITKLPPVLTLTSNTSNPTPNGNITVSGYLKYEDTGISDCQIYLYDGETYKDAVYTDSNGYYTQSFNLNDGVGVHNLKASYTGNHYLYSETEETININTKYATTLTIQSDNNNINQGGTITLSGVCSIGANQSVKIYQNDVLIDTVTTTTDGAYSKTITLSSGGTYNYKTEFESTNDYYSGISETISVIVKYTTSLTCSISPTNVNVGSSITASGRLTANNLGVGNQTISIAGVNATTNSNGYYSASIYRGCKGYAFIGASYEGNEFYQSSSSGTTYVMTNATSQASLSATLQASNITYGDSIVINCTTDVSNPEFRVYIDGTLASRYGFSGYYMSNYTLTYDKNSYLYQKYIQPGTYTITIYVTGDCTHNDSSTINLGTLTVTE